MKTPRIGIPPPANAPHFNPKKARRNARRHLELVEHVERSPHTRVREIMLGGKDVPELVTVKGAAPMFEEPEDVQPRSSWWRVALECAAAAVAGVAVALALVKVFG